MYKILLILKYLRRKLAPMFAALAVMLCTMMVIIVISVMGGFLDLLRDAARQLTGDVTVMAASLSGFPYYQDLADRLEGLPEVEVATPMIRTFGLLNLAGQTIGVQIEGIRPDEFNRIVHYRDTLQWTTADAVAQVDRRFSEEDRQQPRLEELYRRVRRRAQEADPIAAAMSLKTLQAWRPEPPAEASGDGEAAPGPAPAPGLPGMVIGIEVNPYHQRNAQGDYLFANAALGEQATLTAFPMTRGGALVEPRYQTFTVVNEFKSGLYDVDANVVFVPFEALQRLLGMHRREVFEYDPQTFEPIGEPTTLPGRATEVMVRGAAGFTDMQVRDAVAREVAAWAALHPRVYPPAVLTWQQVHATLLGAVKNETGLVTFLFVIISLVAVVMVATTFYMIVLEKTRDIGVLRAIGASRAGIRHIFLGYGLAVGVVGATAGCAAAYAIVTNLNEIQDLLDRWFGWRMWDPQTYFFDRIPDHVDPTTAAAIVAGAILSSVVGALIPAYLASRQDPVEALRYE